MKNLLILASAALALTGCEGPLFRHPDRVTEMDFTIVNRISSDIRVELRYPDDFAPVTIGPGETSMFYEYTQRIPWGVVLSLDIAPELLHADMIIDGETVPKYIWWQNYWESDRLEGKDEHHSSVSYTLTVTDEVLESVARQNAERPLNRD